MYLMRLKRGDMFNLIRHHVVKRKRYITVADCGKVPYIKYKEK